MVMCMPTETFSMSEETFPVWCTTCWFGFRSLDHHCNLESIRNDLSLDSGHDLNIDDLVMHCIAVLFNSFVMLFTY